MGTSIEQYRSAIGCFTPGGQHVWKRGAREESTRKLYREVVVEMMGERSRATILLLLLMGIVATIGITNVYMASTSTGGSVLVTRSFKIQNPHFSLVARMLLLLAGVESHPGPIVSLWKMFKALPDHWWIGWTYSHISMCINAYMSSVFLSC